MFVYYYRGTQFVQSTNINSVMMPAAFILKFKKPIALSQQTIKQIERLQGMSLHSLLPPIHLDATVFVHVDRKVLMFDLHNSLV